MSLTPLLYVYWAHSLISKISLKGKEIFKYEWIWWPFSVVLWVCLSSGPLFARMCEFVCAQESWCVAGLTTTLWWGSVCVSRVNGVYWVEFRRLEKVIRASCQATASSEVPHHWSQVSGTWHYCEAMSYSQPGWVHHDLPPPTSLLPPSLTPQKHFSNPQVPWQPLAALSREQHRRESQAKCSF